MISAGDALIALLNNLHDRFIFGRDWIASIAWAYGSYLVTKKLLPTVSIQYESAKHDPDFLVPQ